MKKIKIINGPNLNLLGKREPLLYGKADFKDVLAQLQADFKDFELDYVQSNGESEIIDFLHQTAEEGYHGIVLNPASFTHTSIGIGDAVAAIDIPVVEVHISNIFAREAFRQKSYISPYAAGVITGFGTSGYGLALAYFLRS